MQQEVRNLIQHLFELEHTTLRITLDTFEKKWGSPHLTQTAIDEIFEGLWARQEHFEQRILAILKRALHDEK